MATLVYSLVSKLEALWGVGCAPHPAGSVTRG